VLYEKHSAVEAAQLVGEGLIAGKPVPSLNGEGGDALHDPLGERLVHASSRHLSDGVLDEGRGVPPQ
jgi:hypothetical protein